MRPPGKYGIPPIKVFGVMIKPGRVFRSLFGFGIIAALAFGMIEPNDTIQLVIWIAAGVLFIDASLLSTAVNAYKVYRNSGGKKEVGGGVDNWDDKIEEGTFRVDDDGSYKADDDI